MSSRSRSSNFRWLSLSLNMIPQALAEGWRESSCYIPASAKWREIQATHWSIYGDRNLCCAALPLLIIQRERDTRVRREAHLPRRPEREQTCRTYRSLPGI
ncbi:MAG: hypothetical protein BJ554DRAFT_5212, partial [Olpidium bornovanus]